MSDKDDTQKLAEVAKAIAELEGQLKPLYEERNALIRDTDLSIRKAAAAAGVSAPRVQQIRRAV